MEQTTDLHVRIDGVDRSYPRGTRYQTIAEDVQAQYPHRILLVNREGRLCELSKSLDRDCTLKMVTTVDKPGMQTYERSAVLLMLKAFYDVVGRAQIDRVTVEYSISHALFVRAAGRFSLDQALLEQVEARMRTLVSLALPIQKHSVNTWDAVDFFQKNGMPDKARLLSYRISSHVNLYTLDGFTDYFYGYMVPDTSYLTCFGLEPYEDGFVLRLPDQADPARLAEFQPSAKVFRTLHDASDLAMSMGISTVGELNTAISEGQATQMVLAREAMMEKEIGDRRPVLLRQDHLLPPPVHPAHRLRDASPPHRDRQLLQKPGGHPPGREWSVRFRGAGRHGCGAVQRRHVPPAAGRDGGAAPLQLHQGRPGV